MATTATTDTATRILDVAEELVQTRGLNAMSYADISARVGITNASLHYHFPAKADLAIALVDRYAERFFAALDEIERTTPDVADRLRAYVGIYGAVLASGRMCLCGMLASDFETLPGAVQERVSEFFERSYTWLERVIDQGVAAGRIPATVSSHATAQSLVAGLEGAMLVSRPAARPERFDAIADALLASIGVSPSLS
jgi:TetR/AcrR family transcriptional repressor of nem operon